MVTLLGEQVEQPLQFGGAGAQVAVSCALACARLPRSASSSWR